MSERKPKRFSISLGHLFLLSNLAIGILGFGYLDWVEGRSQVNVWVPRQNLPAYTQIQVTDLVEQAIPARNVSSDMVKEISAIRDRYTVVEISKGRPINRRQLGPELTADQKKSLQSTVLIGISATPAMVLGGNLQAGDSVDIELIQNTPESQPISIQFDNMFVVDIKPALSNTTATTSATTQPSEWAVVLAIPANQQEAFSRSMTSGKVVLLRKF